jgi:hypothetical protein
MFLFFLSLKRNRSKIDYYHSSFFLAMRCIVNLGKHYMFECIIWKNDNCGFSFSSAPSCSLPKGGDIL